MDNGQLRSLNVLMSISVSLNKEQSTPLASFAVATTRGWETRAGSSLSLLTHAIQWVRTENEVCVPLWTCQSFHWIPFLPVQYVQYAMAAKTFWLAPPGVAQLSDLVLEGTSFSIKKQGTTVKRNETYFVLLFFSNCWLFFHWCFLDSPATFSNFISLAYSLVFFTHLAFAKAHDKTRPAVLFLLTKQWNTRA